LQFLKQRENNFPIEVSSPNSSLGRSNSYFHSSTDTIKKIDLCNESCILLSVNPRVECSVINSRLRVKIKNTLLSIIALNQYFAYNSSIDYVNLNIFKSLNIFEGIYPQYSESLVQSNSPLVLLSNSINKRLTSFSSDFIFCLKLNFNSIVSLNISSSSNKQALDYLNIEYPSYEKLRKQKELPNGTAFCFNLDDNFSLAKHFFSFADHLNKTNRAFIKHLYKFTSHYNSHQKRNESRVYIPTLSEFEDEAIFLNLEGRPQKNLQMLS